MRAHREAYDDVGEVAAYVADLEARWQEELERRRVFVAREEAAFEIEALLPAPPAVAWEHLTAPEKRSIWQRNGARVEETSPGGRRGAGTTSFCVDGRTSIYEEILDWRPFQYFTERMTLAGLELVLTTELEPSGEGTLVRVRGRRPEGGRTWWLLRGGRLRADLERRYGRLASMLAAASGATMSRSLPVAEPPR